MTTVGFENQVYPLKNGVLVVERRVLDEGSSCSGETFSRGQPRDRVTEEQGEGEGENGNRGMDSVEACEM